MPIYEYQCTKCKKTFEYMQSFSEAPKKKCEKCGGKLEKLMSAAGFILKGGGWYKDLYASTKPGADKGSDDAPAKTESSSSSSESKPAKADKPAKDTKSDKKGSKKKANA